METKVRNQRLRKFLESFISGTPFLGIEVSRRLKKEKNHMKNILLSYSKVRISRKVGKKTWAMSKKRQFFKTKFHSLNDRLGGCDMARKTETH